MAGGVGSRLWPESRQDYPKQFHDILGSGKTLIQKTFDRLNKKIPTENILILTNQRYLDLTKKQLPEIEENQIVLEPAMRNTAPCILLAALKIQKINPEGLMVVAPSDHWIEDENAFLDNLQNAFDTCQRNQNMLMTLGIQPTLPHTGYGYIQFEENEKSSVKKVVNFTEKPNYETAQMFIASGDYVWNAGIFVWSVKAIVKAFENYLPEMFSLFEKGIGVYNSSKERAFLEENYANAENISIDYGVMEKAEEVSVIPAEFDWNDLGSWASLYDKMQHDENENVAINAQLLADNSGKNFVKTSKEKIVVLKDLNEYIVIENEDVIYIGPKNKEQAIKEIRERVKDELGEHLI
ncbi:mannose-1-phosphate guanylyltransferase [Mesonia sp. K7]|nr:mannose-1-phosphate guanylyltransferase [Mesonia sp. K7]